MGRTKQFMAKSCGGYFPRKNNGRQSSNAQLGNQERTKTNGIGFIINLFNDNGYLQDEQTGDIVKFIPSHSAGLEEMDQMTLLLLKNQGIRFGFEARLREDFIPGGLQYYKWDVPRMWLLEGIAALSSESAVDIGSTSNVPNGRQIKRELSDEDSTAPNSESTINIG